MPACAALDPRPDAARLLVSSTARRWRWTTAPSCAWSARSPRGRSTSVPSPALWRMETAAAQGACRALVLGGKAIEVALCRVSAATATAVSGGVTRIHPGRDDPGRLGAGAAAGDGPGPRPYAGRPSCLRCRAHWPPSASAREARLRPCGPRCRLRGSPSRSIGRLLRHAGTFQLVEAASCVSRRPAAASISISAFAASAWFQRVAQAQRSRTTR